MTLRLLFVVFALVLPLRARAQSAPAPEVALSGVVQFDARWHDPATGPAGPWAFLLRRARVEVEAAWADRVRFVLEPDFGEGEVELKDAWLETRLAPQVYARAGHFKTPFGFEVLRSSRALWFAERGLPSSLAPRRDLGVMLRTAWAAGRSEASVGAFGGVPDGRSSSFQPAEVRDVAGRVFVRAGAGALDGLAAGVGVTAGTARGSDAAPAFLPVRLPSGTALRLAQPLRADGARYRLAPQASFERGRFAAAAEFTATWQRVLERGAGEHARVARQAWQVAARWGLHAASGVEVAARAQGLKVGEALAGGGRAVTGLGVAAHWAPAPGLRLTAGVDRFTGSALAAPDLAVVLRLQQQF